MGHIYKRGQTYWIKYYRDGKAFFETSGSKKEGDARRLLKLREGDIARGLPVTPRTNRIRFSELAEDVLTDYRVNGRRTAKDVQRRFRLYLLPFFGGHRAVSINTASIRRYIQRRQIYGAANATINRELAALKRAFSLAVKDGKLLTKPHIPMLRENNIRRGFFERSQFEQLCRYLPDDLRPVVTFAYITGWRMDSEILTLQWRQVDLEEGRVVLDPGTTKNDCGRVFPFSSELQELLERQAETARRVRARGVICPWVFHRNGQQIKSIRRAWLTACRKAGVPGRIPHDLRRTAVRNLVRAGIPERWNCWGRVLNISFFANCTQRIANAAILARLKTVE